MDVILIADDGIKCHGWFIPAPNDTKAHALTLLFSHEREILKSQEPTLIYLC